MRSMQSALEETVRHPAFVFESEIDFAVRLNYRFILVHALVTNGFAS
jgi:hypothetical protein